MIPKIEMKNIAKAFGPKKVLRGVDLKVDQGESLVIIGALDPSHQLHCARWYRPTCNKAGRGGTEPAPRADPGAALHLRHIDRLTNPRCVVKPFEHGKGHWIMRPNFLFAQFHLVGGLGHLRPFIVPEIRPPEA